MELLFSPVVVVLHLDFAVCLSVCLPLTATIVVCLAFVIPVYFSCRTALFLAKFWLTGFWFHVYGFLFFFFFFLLCYRRRWSVVFLNGVIRICTCCYRCYVATCCGRPAHYNRRVRQRVNKISRASPVQAVLTWASPRVH